MRTKRNLQWTLAGATVLVAAGLVTASLAAMPQVGEASGTEYVLEQLSGRADAMSSNPPLRSIDDFLPNTAFSVDGKEIAPLSSGVIIGEILSAEGEAGYMIEGDDAPSGIQIPFDDSRALWRVVRLSVKVDKAFGNFGPGDVVHVGISISGSTDSVRAVEGLSNLGSVILPLGDPGFFSSDPSLYSIGWSGALLGTIGKDGEIRFPLLGLDNEEQFTNGAESIHDLELKAGRGKVTIPLVKQGSAFIRP